MALSVAVPGFLHVTSLPAQMALVNGTNNPVNGDSVLVNGSSSDAPSVKIKNKAALKRAKQKKAKLTAVPRESSVVCIRLHTCSALCSFLQFRHLQRPSLVSLMPTRNRM